MILPNLVFAKDSKKVGKITAITGTVQVQKSGGEKKFKAFKGMAITQGDTVITSNSGKATLELDSDKEVSIGPGTKLLISELVDSIKAGSGKTTISLLGGDVMVHVKKKLEGDSRFEVKTPTAIMGIMGTQFVVSYDPSGNSLLSVFEGTVAATPPTESQEPPKPVHVHPSQQLEIQGGSSPGSNPVWMPPTGLDPAKLPLFVLEQLALNPISGLSEELLKKIQDELKKKQQEEANKPKTPVFKPADTIIYEGSAGNTQPSGGSGGNSGGGSDGGVEPISTTISHIENVNLVEGDSVNREFTVTPADAEVIVTYSVGGFENTLQILGNGQYRWGIPIAREQNLVATVTATKSGYVSATKSFQVNVLPNPNPFVISKGILDLYSDEDFRIELGVKEGVDLDRVYLIRPGIEPLLLEKDPYGSEGYSGDYYLANINLKSQELVLKREFKEILRANIDSSYTVKLSLLFTREGYPIEPKLTSEGYPIEPPPPLLITLDVNPIPIVEAETVVLDHKTISIPFVRGISLNSHEEEDEFLKQNIQFIVEGSSDQYDWTEADKIEIIANELVITLANDQTGSFSAYIIIMEGTLKDSISKTVQPKEICIQVIQEPKI